MTISTLARDLLQVLRAIFISSRATSKGVLLFWGQSISLGSEAPFELLYSSGLKHPASVGGANMNDPQVGWIAAIIIGGVAGWLAEQFMKSDMGLVMNIVLGVIGAAVASAIFSFFGINLGGWLGYLIAGFVGACLLIWIVRTVRGATA